ncbi:hypothetical protein CB473P1_00125 [Enterocloster phage CB473P1]|nr:hypothetical protein CB473P1_00125 [Enterocloster phage CB473P1]
MNKSIIVLDTHHNVVENACFQRREYIEIL